MERAKALTITLPPELAHLVEAHLDAGEFEQAEEVMGAALRLLPVRKVTGSEALAALGGVSDVLALVDKEWRFSFINEAYEQYFGLRSEDTLGRVIWSVFPQWRGSPLEAVWRAAMEERRSVMYEGPGVAKPGHWLEVRAFPVGDGIAIAGRDVTKRTQREDALRASEARLRDAAETLRIVHKAARAATWEWRPEDGGIRWNDPSSVREMLGDTLPDRPAHSFEEWMQAVPEEEREDVRQNVRRVWRSGEGRFEFRVRNSDGNHIWLDIAAKVVERTAGGAPSRIIGITVDVTGHKAVEQSLRAEIVERRRAEHRQRLLIHELNHRVKNTLATVQSMARQSLAGASDPATGLERFTGRLLALSAAHNILTAESWGGADLREIVTCALRPYECAKPRFAIEGGAVQLGPRAALALALALHELATNAVKYGALSNDVGRITVSWRETGQVLDFKWRETGGPPVTAPARRGFGSRLIERGLAAELAADVTLEFPRRGLVCRIRAHLSAEHTLGLA